MPEPARERRVTAPTAPLDDRGARSWGAGKGAVLAWIVGSVVLLDYVTKQLVVSHFRPFQQIELVGDYVRLTFIQNTGAAFGIHVGGGFDRVLFLLLTCVALVALAAMFWATPARDRVRLVAIALISAGALGNMLDRLRSARGVIDFVDIGAGDLRWPIFNVADIAVTAGAILLALSLWGEERHRESARPAEPEPPPLPPGERRGR